MDATERLRSTAGGVLGSPPWLTLGLLALLLVVSVLPAHLQAFGYLNQNEPLALWRLVSAHWLHQGADHLLWNAGGLLLLGAWCEQQSRRHLLIALCIGMLSVGLWFLCLGPTELYCGLSGVLHTLLIFALMPVWREARVERDRVAQVLVLGILGIVLAKTGFELISDDRWFQVGRWPSAPGAHAAGLIGGSLFAGLFLKAKR